MIKRTAKIILICTSALIATALVMPASAQDNDKRLKRIEKQLKAVQRKVFGSEGIPVGTTTGPKPASTSIAERKLVADMSVKISSIEKQLRDITGRLETIEHSQEQLSKKLELLSKDTSIRFDEMRENAASSTANKGGEGEVSAKAEPVKTSEMALPDGDVNSRYDWAFAYIRKNDLKNGQKALELFLAEYPTDAVSANAYFWLGRVHLQNGKYRKAAEQFLSVFEGFPKHKKAPESLVELGGAMMKLNDNGSACEAFLEFRRAYPDATDRLKRRVDGDEKKAGC